MQIVEVSALGVRAAILRLRRPTGQLEFLLFPMVHVASPSFYAAVQSRLPECDLILCEGVDGAQTRILTLACRTLVKSKRLSLVAQNDALDLRPFQDRLVHADVSYREFQRGWHQVPFHIRVLVLAVAPLYGLYLRFFGTRELLARYAEFNDLPSADEIRLYDRDLEKLDYAVLGQRDAHLIDTIKLLVRDHGQEPKLVGILYGAHHMRAVIRFLSENQSYHVADGEWVTVFEY